ncbi:hypothetical protein [Burkholderia sp. BCC1985]|uniref:hypothetical protein n=1 Tax=Burkholderia sp. BCC1985 TaxID=2817442 RepID=UPI002AB250E3|nr:hypothetical protein [Burkholderia sp. BCC1985]
MNFLQKMNSRANDPTLSGPSLYDTAPSGKPDISGLLILFSGGILGANMEIEFPQLMPESDCRGGRSARWNPSN